MTPTLVLLIVSACSPTPFEEVRDRMERVRARASVTFEDLIADCGEQILPALLLHARDANLRVRYRSLFELQNFPDSVEVRDQCVREIVSRTDETLRTALECLLALHDPTLQPVASELTRTIGEVGLEMYDEPCLAVQLLTRLHSLGSSSVTPYLRELRDRGETLRVEEDDDELLRCSRVALARLCDDEELAVLLNEAETARSPQDLVLALRALADTERGESAYLFLEHVGNSTQEYSTCVLNPRVNQAAGYGLSVLLGMPDIEDAFDVDKDRLAEILDRWERGESAVRPPARACAPR